MTVESKDLLRRQLMNLSLASWGAFLPAKEFPKFIRALTGFARIRCANVPWTGVCWVLGVGLGMAGRPPLERYPAGGLDHFQRFNKSMDTKLMDAWKLLKHVVF